MIEYRADVVVCLSDKTWIEDSFNFKSDLYAYPSAVYPVAIKKYKAFCLWNRPSRTIDHVFIKEISTNA